MTRTQQFISSFLAAGANEIWSFTVVEEREGHASLLFFVLNQKKSGMVLLLYRGTRDIAVCEQTGRR